MARKGILFLAFCLIISLSAQGIDFKKSASVTLLEDKTTEDYFVAPRFASADYCTVRHDVEGELWAVTHWITGMELYKSYQDPGLACEGPYPFSVEKIYIVLWFDVACTIYLSVDVETADLTQPTCPKPGYLLSLSQTYSVDIPGQGLYQIEVPLDSPAVVEEPYFAGVYFADWVDSLWGAALVTDDVPTPCVSYNIWDTTIGFVDLYDTGFPDFPQFPGRLLLYSAGTAGGGGGVQPEPSIVILKPGFNEIVGGELTIWAAETSGSNIIDYVTFAYRGNGSWFEIGTDTDGSRALRNGVDPSGTGEGFTMDWDYSTLAEASYRLKATVYDTLGRSDVESLTVSIDPTPPDPVLINPGPMDTICHPLTLEATTGDENVTLMKFEKKAASTGYLVPIITLDQSQYGDNNGNPADGNLASAGEYGEYYCGPVAAAIAIKYWFDKGFIYCMREGNQYLSVDTVVERLAEVMRTRRNDGTYDELFYSGLQTYITTHGNELRLNAFRKPDYLTFRTIFEERELLTILGLSGSPGLYLVAAGASGLEDSSGRYAIKASDPLTGTIIDTYIRNSAEGSEIYHNTSWHPLDIIITVMGYSHSVSRDFIGGDNSAVDGWTMDWPTSDMSEDSLYFITATATDATARNGTSTSLSLYRCTPSFQKADYNGDGVVNVGDALYLIDFIYKNGSAPAGGEGRADANCDGNIDASDVIFAIKYILTQSGEPCY